MAAEINATIAKGDNPADAMRKFRKEPTLGELFSDYLERHAKIHKKSWVEDKQQFNRYMKKFSGRKLSSFQPSDFQRLHHKIGDNNGVYAANRLLSLLRAMFNRAREWGLWNKDNPTLGIKKFKEKSRDRFIQSDELPKFFQALQDEENGSMRDYFLISLLTGARRANVLGLRWADINFTRNEWRIEETKNGESQTVPLTLEVVGILKERKKQADSVFIFPGVGKSGHMVEPKSGWKRILKRAGLEDLRIHDLRRTLGSWQAASGSSLPIIGKSLNHKNASTTSIYARLDIDPVRKSVETANEAILKAANKPIEPTHGKILPIPKKNKKK
jgi:integrase|tara:strand:+ start:395 stop:1384 length:990 start_codon:yes stop_codon:yes gene_type:complete